MAASDAAAKQGVSAVTARKWLGRYLADRASGLMDKSSRPESSPRAIEPRRDAVYYSLVRQLIEFFEVFLSGGCECITVT